MLERAELDRLMAGADAPRFQAPAHWSASSQELRLVPITASSPCKAAGPGGAAASTGAAGSGGVWEALRRFVRPAATGQPASALQLARAWRVENPRLWRRYLHAQEGVEAELRRLREHGLRPHELRTRLDVAGVDLLLPNPLRAYEALERRLLHGTRPDTLMHILAHGFNERYAGSSAGSRYGEGAYFADDAAKCDQYVRRDAAFDRQSELHALLYSDSHRHAGDVFYLLVARASLGYLLRTADGRTALAGGGGGGGGALFATPNKRELVAVPGISPPVMHHSLFAEASPNGPIAQHSEFVVFHGEYAYPEYLLAYYRRAPQSS